MANPSLFGAHQFELFGGCFALVLGLVTWAILHHREVRGDYALVFFASATASVHYMLSTTGIEKYTTLSPLRCLILFVLTFILSCLGSTVVYRLSPYHPLSSFPGPLTWRISTLSLCLIVYWGKSHEIIDDLHKKYGKFVRIGPNMLSVNSPDAPGIINSSLLHMEKSNVYKQPADVKGMSLFFKQGRKEHTNRRKVWAKALSVSAVNNFQPALSRRTEQLIDLISERMVNGGVVNLNQCIELWSYDFMGDVAFGGCSEFDFMRKGDPGHFIQRGHEAQSILLSFGHCPWLIDILWHVPVSKSVHGFRLWSASIMRRRAEAKETDFKDLFSYLLRSDSLGGSEPIPLQDLELEASIVLQASTGTMVWFLVFAIYYIIAHPQVHKRLLSELHDAHVERSGNDNSEKLSGIPILDPIIIETLRLAAPWFMPRIVPPEGIQIENRFIPESTIVLSPSFSQQIAEENFPYQPRDFIPERWLPGPFDSKFISNKKAVVQFSSGPFSCPGKSLAMMELRYAIVQLFSAFHLSFPPSFNCQKFEEGFKFSGQAFFDTPLMVIAVRR